MSWGRFLSQLSSLVAYRFLKTSCATGSKQLITSKDSNLTTDLVDLAASVEVGLQDLLQTHHLEVLLAAIIKL